MKFLQIFWMGYRNFLRHLSIFFTYLFLSYLVLVLLIGFLEFKFSFNSNQFSIENLSVPTTSSIIYAIKLWAFLYFLYLLNSAYITFVSFEKRSLNVFKKIFYFIKFCGFSFHRLTFTFFLKPLLFGILCVLPFLFLAVSAFFMDFYNVSKPVVSSIITLLSFPAFGLCIVLIIYYYIRLSLVEYSVLINKNTFFEAYEISMTGVEGSKLAILLSGFVNVGLFILLYMCESAMAVAPHTLISDIDSEELWQLDTHITLFSSFFYSNIPLIPIWAMYIGNCMVFKSYSFRNDLESAEKSWENLY